MHALLYIVAILLGMSSATAGTKHKICQSPVSSAAAAGCTEPLNDPAQTSEQRVEDLASRRKENPQKFAYIIGNEDRIEFPNDRKGKYAATGLLDCDDSGGTAQGPLSQTAQITYRADIITTAGHMFYHKKECDRNTKLVCIFIVNVGGKVTREPVRMDTVQTGGCPDQDRRQDWATARLQSALKNITPYALPPAKYILNDGTETVFVSQFSLNFERNGRYPPTIQTCKIRRVLTPDKFVPIQQDCDTGKGSSGGAHLVTINNSLIAVAINVGQFDFWNQKNEEWNIKNSNEFDNNIMYNVSVAISGAFRKSIIEQSKSKQ
ncbi:hypothetical protein [Xanthobacter autotrophicus]|uniref:hypothetical protein n=1 Tax=Xanthobacter autotrophicus TaxID=280 RepID=UPI003727C247